MTTPEIPSHASTQAALGTVKAGIIRHTVQENIQVNALGVIPPFSFQPPGGVSGWQRVRISNYSPYLFQVVGIPGGGSGDPPQLLQPFQQNVWNYRASRGTITLIAAEEGSPLAIPPLQFAYSSGTATGDLLFNFVTVEWTDTPDLFFGYYPCPLTGIEVSAEAIRVGATPTVLPTGVTPIAVALLTQPAGSRAYIANSTSHDLTVYDIGTNILVGTIPLGLAPTDVAVNPVTNKVYVTVAGSHLVQIYQESFAGLPGLIGTVNVGADQTAISVESDGHKYVSLAGVPDVAILDPFDVDLGNVAVGNGPMGSGSWVRPAGPPPPPGVISELTYVANETDGTVTCLSSQVVRGVPLAVGVAPVDIVMDTDHIVAYVANKTDGTVSIVQGNVGPPGPGDEGTVLATPAVGASPVGVALNLVTGKVYVANQGTNSVSVIDTTTHTVVDTLAPGVGPTDVAVNPLTNLVYVTIAADALVVLAGV